MAEGCLHFFCGINLGRIPNRIEFHLAVFLVCPFPLPTILLITLQRGRIGICICVCIVLYYIILYYMISCCMIYNINYIISSRITSHHIISYHVIFYFIIYVCGCGCARTCIAYHVCGKACLLHALVQRYVKQS